MPKKKYSKKRYSKRKSKRNLRNLRKKTKRNTKRRNNKMSHKKKKLRGGSSWSGDGPWEGVFPRTDFFQRLFSGTADKKGTPPYDTPETGPVATQHVDDKASQKKIAEEERAVAAEAAKAERARVTTTLSELKVEVFSQTTSQWGLTGSLQIKGADVQLVTPSNEVGVPELLKISEIDQSPNKHRNKNNYHLTYSSDEYTPAIPIRVEDNETNNNFMEYARLLLESKLPK
jgi:hypothetical protein